MVRYPRELKTLLVLSCWLMLSCGASDPPRESEPSIDALILLGGWDLAVASQDPYREHRPLEVVCPEGAYLEEEIGGVVAFDVDTAKCNYFTGMQSTLLDLAPGDEIAVRLFHYALEATRPAKAHVALNLGGDEIWSEEIAIPAPSALLRASVPVGKRLDAGTMLYYHVHNHGDNTWSLLSINRVRSSP